MSHLTIPPELNVWASPEVFVVDCQAFSPSESDAENAELFGSITRLARYAYGEEPRVRNGGGGSRRSFTRPKQPELTHFIGEYPGGFLLGDPDDPDQLPGHYNILAEPSDSADGELAPGELGSSNEIWVLDDDGVERPYVADLLSQQGIEAHIVRSRQLLPFTYTQFTLAELRDLLFGASDLFYACLQERPRAQDASRVRLRMEAILMLHISLWLGQATTQVVQLSVVDSTNEDAPGVRIVVA